VIRFSKVADERREAGAIECWLLHGAVGIAADWRAFAKRLAEAKVGTRAVDMWRFLEQQPLPLEDFGAAFNADAAGEVNRGNGRVLMGYSMGGRLALHALLEKTHPWQAAVILSAHPGLEHDALRESRRAADAAWAAKALAGNWQDFLTEWNAQAVLGGAMPRDAGAAAAMAQHRREIARGFVDWSLGAQQPLWDRLCDITIPILWVAGEKDARFLELAQRAVAALPQARLAVAPDTGHRVPWEAEEWLARETAAFLTSGS
jgi:2-succinyl-6-hydroxy-2,4-cyclohexadiene-1-carboxylate synthase